MWWRSLYVGQAYESRQRASLPAPEWAYRGKQPQVGPPLRQNRFQNYAFQTHNGFDEKPGGDNSGGSGIATAAIAHEANSRIVDEDKPMLLIRRLLFCVAVLVNHPGMSTAVYVVETWGESPIPEFWIVCSYSWITFSSNMRRVSLLIGWAISL